MFFEDRILPIVLTVGAVFILWSLGVISYMSYQEWKIAINKMEAEAKFTEVKANAIDAIVATFLSEHSEK